MDVAGAAPDSLEQEEVDEADGGGLAVGAEDVLVGVALRGGDGVAQVGFDVVRSFDDDGGRSGGHAGLSAEGHAATSSVICISHVIDISLRVKAEPQRMDASTRTSGTGTKLIAAAAAEFNDHGFSGTDSNKIARRAGFAPQTFYRWFKDNILIAR